MKLYLNNLSILLGKYCYSKTVDFLICDTYNDIRIIKMRCIFVRAALRRRSIFLLIFSLVFLLIKTLINLKIINCYQSSPVFAAILVSEVSITRQNSSTEV